MPFLITLMLLFSAALAAESWAPPRTLAVLSDNTDYLVRTTPGQRLQTAAKARLFHWDGQQYQLQHEFQLHNPLSPVKLWLSNDGELITVDQWADRQAANLSWYDQTGKLKLSVGIASLMPEPQAKQTLLQLAEPGGYWRCPTLGGHFSGQQFYLPLQNGELRVDLELGTTSFTENPSACPRFSHE